MGQFLSEEEASTLSPTQRKFIVRKRMAAAGLGPIMPPESNCQSCSGMGSVTCHQCEGTGRNATDKAQELFNSEEHGVIKVNNGLVDPRWLFVQGGPCWLCKAREHIACPDCAGTGIRGGVDRYTGD